MASSVYFEGQQINFKYKVTDVFKVTQMVSKEMKIPVEDMYMTLNGKPLAKDSNDNLDGKVLRFFVRLVGGKGGFGSMLRAIGAQIEKTTNREACRDLSGRRLRDINEEQRLRKWLNGQADREKESAERKQKKLERLCAEPVLPKLEDPKYEAARAELPERVCAAVDAGFAAAAGGSGKRKAEQKGKGKKKARLWIDADLSDCSGSNSEDEGCDSEKSEGTSAKAIDTKTGTSDSGNESDVQPGTSKQLA